MNFPSNLISYVKSQLQQDHEGEVEVEARIGVISVSRYFKAFDKIASTMPRVDQYMEVDVLYNSPNGTLRKRERLTEPQRTEVIEKRLLKKWTNFNTDNYGINIAVSVERLLNEDVDRYTPILLRSKKRTSFAEPHSPYRFDLSEVKEVNLNNVDMSKVDWDVPETYRSGVTNRYELEVEILQLTETALEKFHEAVKKLFQYAYNSNIPYTLSQRSDMFSSINIRIGGEPLNDRFDLNVLTQARNLTVNDLSYGAMIPYIVKPGSPGMTEYYVTAKADGNRVLLIVEKDGFWVGSIPDGLNHYTHKSVTYSPKWIGTVFECEEVPIKNRTLAMANYRGMYVVIYDCIYTQNNSQLREQTLVERLKLVKDFVAEIDPNNPMVLFSAKVYYPCRTIPEFYTSVQAFIDNTNALSYKTDGLIFTPNSGYLPTGNVAFSRRATTKDTKMRTLANYTDICKWKPRELNTFDVLFEKEQFWIISNNGGLEVFKPNGKELITGDIIYDMKPAVFNEGVVYEIGWDFTLGKPLLHRARYNKTLPNSAKVAYDAWRMLFNPLDVKALLGRDLTLMRRYQNREKARVLNMGSGRLLDLGSGRGGDILKWSKYTKIYAIEPSEQNRLIFNERLKEQTDELQNKIELFPYYAQDTDKIWQAIQQEPVDTISMMLSLTFLFKDTETLQGLINTIDKCLAPGGQLLVTVMDGDLVKATMANGLVVHKDGKTKLAFPIEGVADFDVYDDNHTVDITLYGTIVENQTEYLTRMRELSNILAEKGFKLTTNYILDRERFLNPIESALTRMYAAWCWQREQSNQEEFMPPIPKVPSIGYVPQGIEGKQVSTVKPVEKVPMPQEEVQAVTKPKRRLLTLAKTETTPEPKTESEPTTVTIPAVVTIPAAVKKPAVVTIPTTVKKPAAVTIPTTVKKPAAVTIPTTVKKSEGFVIPAEIPSSSETKLSKRVVINITRK